ncbi:MAG: CHASE4 domain-containing protein [Methanomassiliicoccales archaeon]
MKKGKVWESVRFKTIGIAVLIVIGLILAVYILSSSINMANFERLERDELEKNLERLSRLIERDLDSIGAMAEDWSNWDDVYYFVATREPDFIETNMGQSTLDYMGLDLIAFYDKDGFLVYQELFEQGILEDEEVRNAFNRSLASQMIPDGYIITKVLAGEETTGMMVVNDEILLMSAKPILTSLGEGPINGVLLMGLIMDDERQGTLSDLLEASVSFFTIDSPKLWSELGSEAMEILNQTGSANRVKGKDAIAGYMRLNDVYGSNIVVIRAEVPRSIYLQGQASQSLLLLALSCSIALFGAFTIGLMETWVISRISKLSNEVNEIAESGDTSRRIAENGKDEIGELSSNINAMLTALEDGQRQMMEMERTGREKLENLVRERTAELLESNRALSREVEERQRTEEELRQSESRYRAVVEDQTELIKRTLPDGTITFVNQAFARYYSSTPQSLIGTKFSPEMPKEDAELVSFSLQSITSDRPVVSYQHRVLLPKGNEVWQQWTSRGIFDGSGKLQEIQSVGRDITERIRFEQEMLRTQKLESLGRLAGGIAHEFNNILTSIVGNITLARMEKSTSHELERRLQDAENSALKAKNLTQQLLTFAQGGDPIKEISDVTALVKDSADLLTRGSNVTLVLDLPSDPWMVEIDPEQMRQALNNIIINAIESMPEGGKLLISARNLVIEGSNELNLPPNNYIMIEFSDEGHGIPENELTRIFDPFFTTKKEGSGLGLTVALSIIRKHGGHITVDSQVGRGSTFRLYLPAVKKTSQEAPLLELKDKNCVRILLMDDEISILEIVSELLTALGYEVDCARNGEEALEAYQRAQKSGKGFDLILMDLTIRGGMGGREAIRKLRELHPEVRAIVSSGYSNDPIMSDFRSHGFVGVLRKPYTFEELKDAISSALEAKIPE